MTADGQEDVSDAAPRAQGEGASFMKDGQRELAFPTNCIPLKTITKVT